MRTKTERIGNAWRGCLHGIVQRDTWITIFLAAGLLSIGVAIWVSVKYGPHFGIMCALLSHVMFRVCKMLTLELSDQRLKSKRMKSKTNNRKSKTRAGSLRRFVKRVDALILAGNKASNICYNLAQKSDGGAEKSIMQETYREWDSAKMELRKLLPS